MATSPNYGWLEPDNTDLVKNGALAIRTLGNAIDTTMATMVPKSIVDAKGDLIAGTAADTPARLAVGSNGETLVADSSTATGLRYQANFAAGKNKIINGDFGIWQRGTSFTPSSGTVTYTADRFYVFMSGTYSATISQQSFTAGSAPAAPYESPFFWRNTISSITGSLSFNRFAQRIEDVRTLANQAVTISFWAKAGANASWTPQLVQDFGSGGSSAVFTSGTAVSVTTSWQRFTQTITLPSISGKTIGTGNNLTFLIDFPVSGAQTNDVWGVQVEAGSVATSFQTATGTIQGELAACKYYYQRISSDATSSIAAVQLAFANSTTSAMSLLPIATMRTTPSVGYSAVGNFYLSDLIASANYTTTAIAISGIRSTNNVVFITHTVASGLTSGRAYSWQANTTSTYFDLSAEL